MQNTIKPLCTVALMIGMGLHASVQAQSVNLFNWYEYFGETTLKDFSEKYGIDTKYNTFDSPEVLETKMLTGNSGYDVAYPSSGQLARHIPTGAYQKLDKSKLTNLANIDAKYMQVLAMSDPGNEYAVPYTWGTTGIGYDAAKVEARMPDAPVDSLKMVFDPQIVSKFADCGVFILNSPTSIIPAALTYLGKDPHSEDPKDLKAAMTVLDNIRPYIKHFKNAQVINELAGEELCLALTFSGDVGLAIARAEEIGSSSSIAYSIPKEGAEIYFDVMVIPANAPNVEQAYTFINYILEPEVAAGVTNYTFFANANGKATQFVAEDIRNDPGIYPPAEVEAKLYSTKPYSAKFTRKLNREWTRFKSGN